MKGYLQKKLFQKAESLGCRALCFMEDTTVGSARNREDRVKFKLPDGINAPYTNGWFDRKQPLTRKEMEWLISFAKVAVLWKGILIPDDAEPAMKIGSSGIIVSNHGGRDLDTIPETIEALPRIAERVNKRIPKLMDGGVRRGAEIFKVIAFGANAVLIGRPVCFGLASGGAVVFAKTLEI